MPLSDHYFSAEHFAKGYGDVYFLKVPRNMSKGDESLLGTIAEREHDSGILFWKNYIPVPHHMTIPQWVLRALQQHAAHNEINLAGEDFVKKDSLAGTTQTLQLDENKVFVGGIGPFPGIPATLGLQVDFKEVASVQFSMGEGARFEYIPLGYIGRLHRYIELNPSEAVPVLFDNYVIDTVLIGAKYDVNVQFKKDVSSEFEAKLKALEQIPGIDAKVKFDKVSDNQLSVAS